MATEEKAEPGPPAHEPVAEPDLTAVRAAAAKMMAYLRDPNCTFGQTGHYEREVLEQTMIALYGPTVWEEINNLEA
ncbi:hypothetical protein ABTM44_18200, partial [Acinetobacter baumannii]